MASLLDSVNFAPTITSKLRFLDELKAEFSSSDTLLLSEFLSSILQLLSDPFSPVRKFVAEMIGEVVSCHLELFPEIVPALMTVFDDDAPAVSRQAITSATRMFRSTLEKVALQGLYTSELDDSLQSAWAWMAKLKEKIYSIAFQSGSDGRRALSLKFVEAVILIYTPDPSGSSEPPTTTANEGRAVDINMSWLRKGHPLLNVGDLSVEASDRLRLLLDQLRTPTVKSLSVSMMIVLVNSLSFVATKRPSFYGRILPVLLGLDASNSVIKGIHAYGLQHALKNAFLSCLKCTYSSARPWRDRLVGALKEMKAGELADLAVEEICSINGNVKEEERDMPITQEEPSTGMAESVHSNKGRKRCGDQEFGETSDDSDTSGKRLKSNSLVLEGSPGLSNSVVVDEGITPSAQPIPHAESESGPVQQLVAILGALVAQGEKTAASLDILIASIAIDMLAEVVIANMKYLPPACPNAEGDDEALTSSGTHPGMLESDSRFRQLSLFLSSAISSRTSETDVKQPTPHELKEHDVKEELLAVAGDDHDGASVLMDDEGADETMASSLLLASDSDGFTEVGKGFSSLAVGLQDMENTVVGIPGLDNPPNDDFPGLHMATSLVATDLDDGSQDLDKNLVKRSKVDSLPSVSTDRSEESCPKAVVADANSGIASTATSIASIQQFVLPKIAAPAVDLTDEEKDDIQKVSFARIVKAYKQVAISGGSQLHFSLLAYLGVEFPLELDPWTIIQQHILSDYVNHEGHELTLLVLYKLYREAEERDFFSSTTATSVYEMFLLRVAETLRDSFLPSDKSLNRLLSEVPYLPKSIFELLEHLCCPDDNWKDDKESQIGDRVTQGLSTVWSLIMLRPPIRDALLKIALQSAVHHMEEVRMKAIRLVANKLYPLSSISIQIEDFAKNMLVSVVKEEATVDAAEAEKSSNQSQKNSDNAYPSNEDPSLDAAKDMSCAHQSNISKDTSHMLISEARKCMSLYFALCTKKHSLLRHIFIIYKNSPSYVKQAVHSQMPILTRTIGASPMVLEIISDPPEGSESLLTEVLHTLTDGIIPSPQLINAIKSLYESKGKDVEILFPILSFLPKEEVVHIFPSLVNLPKERFQAAFTRLLQGSAPSGPVLTPEEVLIAIHGVDPEKDRIPLKKVTDACNVCFQQRQIFTQQVLAKVLNQLVEQIPLPLLFMRTVLQAIGAFPALVDFIMGILSRLVNKQIWKYPKLWVGFLKCAQLTQPHSFNVLLQVPSAQLESALNKIPALKAPLVGHASQPEVHSTLTRSTLVVLGLVMDSQNVSPAQAAVPAESTTDEKDATTERSKESSTTN